VSNNAAAILAAPRRDAADVAEVTERTLCGAIWLNPAQAAIVGAIVGPGHFRNPVYGSLYGLLRGMAENGEPFDVALVLAYAERQGADSGITSELLGDVMLSCEAPSRAPELARVVRRQARDRELRRELDAFQRQAAEANGNLSDIIRKEAARLAELAEPETETPGPLSAAELCRKYPELREPIIDGLLRRAEVGNLVAPPKAHKSHALLHLGICIATGRDWLGFPTRKGRVLLMDYELHGETLGQRLRVVLAAEGLTPTDLGDGLAVELLRGRPFDVYDLGRYVARMEPGRYALIIVDPLFRLFPDDMDENSNADIAKIYAMLAGYADRLNAAIVCVHHLSKGPQGDKSLTDLGAGGGAQSRAADAHLSLREHAEPEAAVLAGVVRSFKPFEPLAIRWEYPLWQLAPDLDPADLKRSGRRGRKGKTEPTEPPAPAWTPERFAAEFLTAKPKAKAAIMDATAILGGRHAERLLNAAESQGLAYRWKLPHDKRVYYATETQPTLGSENDG
jgi:RecA-family ATPase